MPKPVSAELPETKVTPDPKSEKRGRGVFTPEYKFRQTKKMAIDQERYGSWTKVPQKYELRRRMFYQD